MYLNITSKWKVSEEQQVINKFQTQLEERFKILFLNKTKDYFDFFSQQRPDILKPQ